MRWGLLGFLSITAWSAPLFPEDGSQFFSKWVTSAGGVKVIEQASRFYRFLKDNDIEIVRLPIEYEWIQDLSFSFQDGSVALQVLVPGLYEGAEPSYSNRYRGWWGFHEPDFLANLTRGVLTEEEGWLRLHPKHLTDLGWASKRLDSSIVEGGDLISGVDALGIPYALVSSTTVARTQAFLKLSDAKRAKEALAQDLGLEVDQIVVLDLGGHLDTQVKALPGGVILIQDPDRIIPTLEVLASRASPDSAERKAYEMSLRLHRYGHQRYNFRGEPMDSPVMPWSLSSAAQSQKAIAQLGNDPRFRVMPIMGRFASIEDEKTSWSMTWYNNLFNAISGQNKRGEGFFIGNRTRLESDPDQTLPQLEQYWTEQLRTAAGLKPERIRFWGRFDGAGGANCTGFPKP
jgi:hypothetical protein